MLEESERFRNFKPLRGESKIVLESYSYGAKRKMLDNHLFESDIPDVLKEVVTDCAFKICDDNNFSPRYLEFFTSAIHVNSFTKVQFYNYIYESLRNPIDIWEHAYIQQISMYDRLLINTLYSLGGIEYYDKLEYVFNERLNFEAINNNYPRPFEPFKTSMKNLNGSFLDIILVNGTQRISFINPSLEDYLNNKIRGNLMEVQRILYSACFIEQWYHFFKPFKDKKESLPSEFFIFFRMNYEKFSKNYLTDNYLYCVSLFLHFFDSNEETLSLELFKKIKDWSLLSNLDFISSHFDFINSLKEHKHFKMLIGYLPSDFFYMTLNLVENIFEVESIIHVLRLYGFDFFAKLKSHNKKSLEYKKAIEVQKNYEELLQWEISFQYEQLMKNTEIDEHLDVIYKIETSCQILKKHINPKLKIEYDNIKNNDWNTIAANNSLDIEIFGEKINPEDYDIYVAQYEYDEYDEVYDYESESKQNYNIDIFNVQESEEEGNDLPF
jgi:hypothetical protein